MMYDDKELEDVKDILILGKFWCNHRESIMIYAQVENKEVENKRTFTENEYTGKVSITGEERKLIPEVKEPNPTVMGSSKCFMISGNGFHVDQTLYAIKVLNESKGNYRLNAMDIVNHMFKDDTSYVDGFGNQLTANRAIPNSVSTPRIIGILYSSPTTGSLDDYAAFGIINEDKDNEVIKTYVEVPLVENRASMLVTYHGNNKPSEIIEMRLRHGFPGSESPQEYQEELTDKILEILGPQAIGVVSKSGAYHYTHVGRLRE